MLMIDLSCQLTSFSQGDLRHETSMLSAEGEEGSCRGLPESARRLAGRARCPSEGGHQQRFAFIRKEDGFVVWYFEAEDPAASLRKLSQTEVSKRWEAKMAEFFEKICEDSEMPDMEWLEQYFHMP